MKYMIRKLTGDDAEAGRWWFVATGVSDYWHSGTTDTWQQAMDEVDAAVCNLRLEPTA
jgi:hypothetical protein